MGKKYLLIVVSLLFVLAIAVVPAQAAAPSIILNGQTLQTDTPPMIENGSTMVPMRAIFEALGARVAWDATTKTITVVKGDTTLELVIGGDVKVNGQKLDVDAQATILNGSTMVPLRFVSEAMGAKVDWNKDTRVITITTATATTPPTIPDVPSVNDDVYGTGTDITDTTDDTDITDTTDTTDVTGTDTEETAADENANDADKTPFALYLDDLKTKFLPEKAEDVSITYQFVITDGNEGNYYLIIKNGECTVGEGTADSPTVTITVGEQLWLDIASGKEDGTLAYFEKKFTVDGDPTLVQKLQIYFAPESAE